MIVSVHKLFSNLRLGAHCIIRQQGVGIYYNNLIIYGVGHYNRAPLAAHQRAPTPPSDYKYISTSKTPNI